MNPVPDMTSSVVMERAELKKELIIGYYHICLLNNYREIVSEQLQAIRKSGLLAASHKIFISLLMKPRSPTYYSENKQRNMLLAIENEVLELFQDTKELFQDPEKLKQKYIIRVLGKADLYEKELLNNMREDCLNWKKNGKSVKIWYIHSKGVSDKHLLAGTDQGTDQGQRDILIKQQNIRSWRLIMEEVIIWNWQAVSQILGPDSGSEKKLETSLGNILDNTRQMADVAGINYEEHQHDTIGQLMPLGGRFFSGNFWWSHSDYIATLSSIPIPSNYLYSEMWICSGNGRFYEFFSTGVNHYENNYFPIPNLKPVGLPVQSSFFQSPFVQSPFCQSPFGQSDSARNDESGKVPLYRPGKMIDYRPGAIRANRQTPDDPDPENKISNWNEANFTYVTGLVTQCEYRKKYQDGKRLGGAYFRYFQSLSTTELADRLNNKMDLLARFLHDFFICCYYCGEESRREATSIAQFFADLIRLNWDFYLAYQAHHEIFHRNLISSSQFLPKGNVFTLANEKYPDNKDHYHLISFSDRFPAFGLSNHRRQDFLLTTLRKGLELKGWPFTLGPYCDLRRRNIYLDFQAEINSEFPSDSILVLTDSKLENNLIKSNKIGKFQTIWRIASESSEHSPGQGPSQGPGSSPGNESRLFRLQLGYLSNFEEITEYYPDINNDCDILIISDFSFRDPSSSDLPEKSELFSEGSLREAFREADKMTSETTDKSSENRKELLIHSIKEFPDIRQEKLIVRAKIILLLREDPILISYLKINRRFFLTCTPENLAGGQWGDSLDRPSVWPPELIKKILYYLSNYNIRKQLVNNNYDQIRRQLPDIPLWIR